eukprot:TRINITY_DN3749_c0_g1_i1.p2 TRINITY_DN3749_c0_g1~~TRINITY_DN3749_c0_g1_i1.p2  ORF type:complete len:129 (-),score=8.50 TRINITY_DN3749_c0_g1_i1:214-600(-)
MLPLWTYCCAACLLSLGTPEERCMLFFVITVVGAGLSRLNRPGSCLRAAVNLLAVKHTFQPPQVLIHSLCAVAFAFLPSMHLPLSATLIFMKLRRFVCCASLLWYAPGAVLHGTWSGRLVPTPFPSFY